MVLRVAAQSLFVHKMRSFLTMLGIVIGVGAVIALVAVGQGTQAQVVSQFESLGSNLLTVTAGTNFGFSRSGLQQTRPAAHQRRCGRDPGPGHVGRAGRPGVQRQQRQCVVLGQDRLAQHQRRDG